MQKILKSENDVKVRKKLQKLDETWIKPGLGYNSESSSSDESSDDEEISQKSTILNGRHLNGGKKKKKKLDNILIYGDSLTWGMGKKYFK